MYAKALGEGFTKAIIRGYGEACSAGGKVDPNFVPRSTSIIVRRYTSIDTYWFPCTGSTHSCKSYATQIAEIGYTFLANSMKIGKIWIHTAAVAKQYSKEAAKQEKWKQDDGIKQMQQKIQRIDG